MATTAKYSAPPPMNPEVKVKWLAALRDPETKQAQGCLRNDDGFCCLGVLTDLYLKENPEEGKWETNDMWNQHMFVNSTPGEFEHPEDALLPLKVRQWAGLEKSFGAHVKISGSAHPAILPELNDGGYSFSQLADLIEEQL